MPAESPQPVIHLRAAGVSFVLDTMAPIPRVLHWGTDLGALEPADLLALSAASSAANGDQQPDGGLRYTVAPSAADGWAGRPLLQGHRGGVATTPRFETVSVSGGSSEKRSDHGYRAAERSAGGEIVVTLRDPVARLLVELGWRLDPHGVLHVSAAVASAAPAEAPPYDLAALTPALPLPSSATEILDFAGLWSHERAPQRLPVAIGGHQRTVRRGKPGADSPYLTVVGEPGFANRRGEVRALHVAWSGDQQYAVERMPEGAGPASAILAGGELLAPGEIRLGAGERYEAPELVYTWSDRGLDGLSSRLHRMLRARPQHPSSPRPLLLNNWEATYFDHDLGRLTGLIDRAAELGVERFVLDDGWFGARRDDTAGLGDWTVSPDAWPRGLAPLVDRVRSHGMQFGLWFEPEMVNPDSELAGEHPDWLLQPSVGAGATSRNQHLLDLTKSDAWRHVHDRIAALVEEHAIDFVKWDHNRDLHEAVSRHPNGDRPAVHEQTLALYRMLDALRERFPALEIESCASGGARVDLGVLARTDRVWASDCVDPVERVPIQRWTSLLIPLELIGSHVGAPRAHTTHRVTDQSFRMAVALFSHAGIEWDVSTCSDEEFAQLRTWSDLYREVRGLLHGGELVHGDIPDAAVDLTGVVALDGAEALYSWSRVRTSPTANSGRVPLPGLDPARRYQVSLVEGLGPAARRGSDPSWVADGELVASGAVLGRAGLTLPNLQPQQALVLRLRAIDD